MATKKKTDQPLRERLVELQHAMQSGVVQKMKMDHEDSFPKYSGIDIDRDIFHGETAPKHLRVGINAVHVFHGALVKLLVDKGIITDGEYLEAMVAGMQDEVKRYEKLLSDRLGKKIRLG